MSQEAVQQPAFGAAFSAGGTGSTGSSSSSSGSASQINSGVENKQINNCSSRGNTLFPLAVLFYHKLTNVAYHKQKLRRLRLDEISSLFHEKGVESYF